MPDRFVFNDETKYNSYGFRVLTAGIDLDRFKENPVMLDAHINSNQHVIGRWENVSVDGGLLSGEPVFDMADEDAKLIAGKVERGFIKAGSMGLLLDPMNFQIEPNGRWVLTKSELMEHSICPVPSNAGALRLYVNKDGALHLLQEDEIKLALSGLPGLPIQNDNQNMKKVFLSVASLVALGLDKHNQADGIDVSLVEEAINKQKDESAALQVKLTATEATLKKFTDAEAAKLGAEVTDFVNSVIPSKYDESDREMLTTLAKTDLAFAKKTAALVPAKTTLSGSVTNPAAPTNDAVKTMDDFQKLDATAQLAFKAANPEAYNKMVAEM